MFNYFKALIRFTDEPKHYNHCLPRDGMPFGDDVSARPGKESISDQQRLMKNYFSDDTCRKCGNPTKRQTVGARAFY